MQGTLACEHGSRGDTLAGEHVNTQATLERWQVSTFLASMTRTLADSTLSFYRIYYTQTSFA